MKLERLGSGISDASDLSGIDGNSSDLDGSETGSRTRRHSRHSSHADLDDFDPAWFAGAGGVELEFLAIGSRAGSDIDSDGDTSYDSDAKSVLELEIEGTTGNGRPQSATSILEMEIERNMVGVGMYEVPVATGGAGIRAGSTGN